MSWLGIDIGTSGCKAVVFDDDGHERSRAHREYDTIMPGDGRAELDSQQVLDRCHEVLAEAASDCLSSDPVRAIGVSSQGEAFTAVSPDGACLTHAMVSFDTRAAAIAREWPGHFGAGSLYARTGHTAHPMFSLFKILWVRDNLQQVWNEAGHFYCFEDLLHMSLGLEPAISYPLAGRTMLFNVNTHQWDEDILNAVGLSPDRLARPLPAGDIVGRLSDRVCEQLNLGKGTIVVAGGHDQPCGALGAGVVQSGKAMYGMGTVECICPAFPEAVFSDSLHRNNLCTYDFTVDGLYTTVAFSLTGGNLLRWYRDRWADAETREARRSGDSVYDVMLKAMPTDPTDLLVLPYFTPTGTPYFDTEIKGAILGLDLKTDRPAILKALLEGVSLEMKLNADILAEAGVRIDEFVATGGGAQSEIMIQLKADVLNKPITAVAVTEAGCLGVAMLGCAAVTGRPVNDVASRWVRPVAAVEPRSHAADAYNDIFETYRQLYPTLKPIMPRRA